MWFGAWVEEYWRHCDAFKVIQCLLNCGSFFMVIVAALFDEFPSPLVKTAGRGVFRSRKTHGPRRWRGMRPNNHLVHSNSGGVDVRRFPMPSSLKE